MYFEITLFHKKKKRRINIYKLKQQMPDKMEFNRAKLWIRQ